MPTPNWADVGMPPKPIQDTQADAKKGFVNDWAPSNDQLPNLPQGNQPKPFDVGGSPR